MCLIGKREPTNATPNAERFCQRSGHPAVQRRTLRNGAGEKLASSTNLSAKPTPNTSVGPSRIGGCLSAQTATKNWIASGFHHSGLGALKRLRYQHGSMTRLRPPSFRRTVKHDDRPEQIPRPVPALRDAPQHRRYCTSRTQAVRFKRG